jgi:hypothetical protein
LFAPQVPSPPQSDIEVVYLRIEELVHPNDFFQEGDVVIFEDVQNLTQVLLDTINVSTHHLNLCATFVLVKEFWELIFFPSLVLCTTFCFFAGQTA